MRGDRSGGPGRPRRVRISALLVLGLTGIGAVAGCGDIEDQSLCPAFDEYLAQRAAVQDIDLDATSAAEAALVAEDYLESVRRLQEVADTRFTVPLNDLEAAAGDVLRTLESVPGDADQATWAPLVEDSLEDAANAAVTVVDTIEPQCPQAGDAG